MFFILLLIIVGLLVLIIYNTLVQKRNRVDSTFAGIDVQLKKRYDLIPNLVETVKGYMQHEQKLLTRLVELRQTPYKDMTIEQKDEMDTAMHSLIEGLHVSIERYPDLKASELAMHLQRTLNETEEQIAAARRSFNAAVLSYNDSLQTFPSNLIAGWMGFSSRSFFEAELDERENVKIV